MRKKNDTVVFTLNNNTKMKMIEYYQDKLRPKTPPYAVFQAEEAGTVITLYTSNKVMFQGENAKEDALLWQEFNKGNDVISEIMNEDKEEGYKNKEDSNSITLPSDITSIGSDEVGTGDYFGPIVVTASYVSKENIKEVMNLGVKDSKKITDDIILKIGPKLIKTIPHSTYILDNQTYNKYPTNMNKIKAILHNKVLVNMVKNNYEDVKYVVVDQFCFPKNYFEYIKDAKEVYKNITFTTKAEDKCFAVAVSSIICRYVFLMEMKKIEEKYQIFIKKGAGPEVDKQAVMIAKKYGVDELSKIAKLNFKNTEKVKNLLENK